MVEIFFSVACVSQNTTEICLRIIIDHQHATTKHAQLGTEHRCGGCFANTPFSVRDCYDDSFLCILHPACNPFLSSAMCLGNWLSGAVLFVLCAFILVNGSAEPFHECIGPALSGGLIQT